jgi:hypothetical protein
MFIKEGMLDNPEVARPEMMIRTEQAPSWACSTPAIQQWLVSHEANRMALADNVVL